MPGSRRAMIGCATVHAERLYGGVIHTEGGVDVDAETGHPTELQGRIDTSVPHSARFWDYILGGKDNYAVDREMADMVIQRMPALVDLARADRAFLGRAVRYLAAEAGIRQFLDVGTGLPTANNTHEVARAAAPESRVVYVDNDPIVLVHARALLKGAAPGSVDYVDADARDTRFILDAAARTLDLDEPVAVMLLGILNFIPADDEARSIVDRLMAAIPPGSYLAISHPVPGEAIDAVMRMWNERGAAPLCTRAAESVAELFGGLELVQPGLVPCQHWRPEQEPDQLVDVPLVAGVAVKR